MNIFKIGKLQNILCKILNKDESYTLEYETIEPTKITFICRADFVKSKKYTGLKANATQDMLVDFGFDFFTNQNGQTILLISNLQKTLEAFSRIMLTP